MAWIRWHETPKGRRLAYLQWRDELENVSEDPVDWAVIVSVLTSVLGVPLGRKGVSVGDASPIGTTIGGVGRSRKEAADVARAEGSVDSSSAWPR